MTSKTLKSIGLSFLLAVLNVGSVFGDSFSLTNSTIQSEKTGKTSYGSYTIGTAWGGKWLISNSGSTYWLQLGRNTDSSKSAYNSHLSINIPSGATNISISIETNNNTALGRTFYACNSNDEGAPTSGYYGSGSTPAANGTASISVTGSPSPTIVYIYPDGTAFVKSVTVTYTAGGGSPTSVSLAKADQTNGTFKWATCL